ncbi:MAG: 2-amino-4-hydroxy-6-hydroxymethyldihydropteridine diphosphokinase [Leptospiraceae bacterium]|nr:2-amino-4-hydroxy-6-hydroxymethyldihydropteridine diphosphokinase [Leptospiraceae bacterium]
MKSYLSLGTNLGDRELYLKQARDLLHNPPICRIIQASEILNTKAMDFADQPDFLNQVIQIETILQPLELLNFTQSIESKIGRLRRFDKGPREIDIDILIYESITEFKSESLTLPHHSIESRPFIGELLGSILK